MVYKHYEVPTNTKVRSRPSVKVKKEKVIVLSDDDEDEVLVPEDASDQVIKTEELVNSVDAQSPSALNCDYISILSDSDDEEDLKLPSIEDSSSEDKDNFNVDIKSESPHSQDVSAVIDFDDFRVIEDETESNTNTSLAETQLCQASASATCLAKNSETETTSSPVEESDSDDSEIISTRRKKTDSKYNEKVEEIINEWSDTSDDDVSDDSSKNIAKIQRVFHVDTSSPVKSVKEAEKPEARVSRMTEHDLILFNTYLEESRINRKETVETETNDTAESLIEETSLEVHQNHECRNEDITSVDEQVQDDLTTVDQLVEPEPQVQEDDSSINENSEESIEIIEKKVPTVIEDIIVDESYIIDETEQGDLTKVDQHVEAEPQVQQLVESEPQVQQLVESELQVQEDDFSINENSEESNKIRLIEEPTIIEDITSVDESSIADESKQDDLTTVDQLVESEYQIGETNARITEKEPTEIKDITPVEESNITAETEQDDLTTEDQLVESEPHVQEDDSSINENSNESYKIIDETNARLIEEEPTEIKDITPVEESNITAETEQDDLTTVEQLVEAEPRVQQLVESEPQVQKDDSSVNENSEESYKIIEETNARTTEKEPNEIKDIAPVEESNITAETEQDDLTTVEQLVEAEPQVQQLVEPEPQVQEDDSSINKNSNESYKIIEETNARITEKEPTVIEYNTPVEESNITAETEQDDITTVDQLVEAEPQVQQLVESEPKVQEDDSSIDENSEESETVETLNEELGMEIEPCNKEVLEETLESEMEVNTSSSNILGEVLQKEICDQEELIIEEQIGQEEELNDSNLVIEEPVYDVVHDAPIIENVVHEDILESDRDSPVESVPQDFDDVDESQEENRNVALVPYIENEKSFLQIQFEEHIKKNQESNYLNLLAETANTKEKIDTEVINVPNKIESNYSTLEPPPSNKIYAQTMLETTHSSEDSNDSEDNLLIDAKIEKVSVYDEKTVDDVIHFVNDEKEVPAVLISIPESEGHLDKDHLEILQQVESLEQSEINFANVLSPAKIIPEEEPLNLSLTAHVKEAENKDDGDSHSSTDDIPLSTVKDIITNKQKPQGIENLEDVPRAPKFKTKAALKLYEKLSLYVRLEKMQGTKKKSARSKSCEIETKPSSNLDRRHSVNVVEEVLDGSEIKVEKKRLGMNVVVRSGTKKSKGYKKNKGPVTLKTKKYNGVDEVSEKVDNLTLNDLKDNNITERKRIPKRKPKANLKEIITEPTENTLQVNQKLETIQENPSIEEAQNHEEINKHRDKSEQPSPRRTRSKSRTIAENQCKSVLNHIVDKLKKKLESDLCHVVTNPIETDTEQPTKISKQVNEVLPKEDETMEEETYLPEVAYHDVIEDVVPETTAPISVLPADDKETDYDSNLSESSNLGITISKQLDLLSRKVEEKEIKEETDKSEETVNENKRRRSQSRKKNKSSDRFKPKRYSESKSTDDEKVVIKAEVEPVVENTNNKTSKSKAKKEVVFKPIIVDEFSKALIQNDDLIISKKTNNKTKTVNKSENNNKIGKRSAKGKERIKLQTDYNKGNKIPTSKLKIPKPEEKKDEIIAENAVDKPKVISVKPNVVYHSKKHIIMRNLEQELLKELEQKECTKNFEELSKEPVVSFVENTLKEELKVTSCMKISKEKSVVTNNEEFSKEEQILTSEINDETPMETAELQEEQPVITSNVEAENKMETIQQVEEQVLTDKIIDVESVKIAKEGLDLTNTVNIGKTLVTEELPKENVSSYEEEIVVSNNEELSKEEPILTTKVDDEKPMEIKELKKEDVFTKLIERRKEEPESNIINMASPLEITELPLNLSVLPIILNEIPKETERISKEKTGFISTIIEEKKITELSREEPVLTNKTNNTIPFKTAEVLNKELPTIEPVLTHKIDDVEVSKEETVLNSILTKKPMDLPVENSVLASKNSEKMHVGKPKVLLKKNVNFRMLKKKLNAKILNLKTHPKENNRKITEKKQLNHINSINVEKRISEPLVLNKILNLPREIKENIFGKKGLNITSNNQPNNVMIGNNKNVKTKLLDKNEERESKVAKEISEATRELEKMELFEDPIEDETCIDNTNVMEMEIDDDINETIHEKETIEVPELLKLNDKEELDTKPNGNITFDKNEKAKDEDVDVITDEPKEKEFKTELLPNGCKRPTIILVNKEDIGETYMLCVEYEEGNNPPTLDFFKETNKETVVNKRQLEKNNREDTSKNNVTVEPTQTEDVVLKTTEEIEDKSIECNHVKEPISEEMKQPSEIDLTNSTNIESVVPQEILEESIEPPVSNDLTDDNIENTVPEKIMKSNQHVENPTPVIEEEVQVPPKDNSDTSSIENIPAEANVTPAEPELNQSFLLLDVSLDENDQEIVIKEELPSEDISFASNIAEEQTMILHDEPSEEIVTPTEPELNQSFSLLDVTLDENDQKIVAEIAKTNDIEIAHEDETDDDTNSISSFSWEPETNKIPIPIKMEMIENTSMLKEDVESSLQILELMNENLNGQTGNVSLDKAFEEVPLIDVQPLKPTEELTTTDTVVIEDDSGEDNTTPIKTPIEQYLSESFPGYIETTNDGVENTVDFNILKLQPEQTSTVNIPTFFSSSKSMLLNTLVTSQANIKDHCVSPREVQIKTGEEMDKNLMYEYNQHSNDGNALTETLGISPSKIIPSLQCMPTESQPSTSTAEPSNFEITSTNKEDDFSRGYEIIGEKPTGDHTYTSTGDPLLALPYEKKRLSLGDAPENDDNQWGSDMSKISDNNFEEDLDLTLEMDDVVNKIIEIGNRSTQNSYQSLQFIPEMEDFMESNDSSKDSLTIANDINPKSAKWSELMANNQEQSSKVLVLPAEPLTTPTYHMNQNELIKSFAFGEHSVIPRSPSPEKAKPNLYNILNDLKNYSCKEQTPQQPRKLKEAKQDAHPSLVELLARKHNRTHLKAPPKQDKAPKSKDPSPQSSTNRIEREDVSINSTDKNMENVVPEKIMEESSEPVETSSPVIEEEVQEVPSKDNSLTSSIENPYEIIPPEANVTPAEPELNQSFLLLDVPLDENDQEIVDEMAKTNEIEIAHEDDNTYSNCPFSLEPEANTIPTATADAKKQTIENTSIDKTPSPQPQLIPTGLIRPRTDLLQKKPAPNTASVKNTEEKKERTSSNYLIENILKVDAGKKVEDLKKQKPAVESKKAPAAKISAGQKNKPKDTDAIFDRLKQKDYRVKPNNVKGTENGKREEKKVYDKPKESSRIHNPSIKKNVQQEKSRQSEEDLNAVFDRLKSEGSPKPRQEKPDKRRFSESEDYKNYMKRKKIELEKYERNNKRKADMEEDRFNQKKGRYSYPQREYERGKEPPHHSKSRSSAEFKHPRDEHSSRNQRSETRDGRRFEGGRNFPPKDARTDKNKYREPVGGSRSRAFGYPTPEPPSKNITSHSKTDTGYRSSYHPAPGQRHSYPEKPEHDGTSHSKTDTGYRSSYHPAPGQRHSYPEKPEHDGRAPTANRVPDFNWIQEMNQKINPNLLGQQNLFDTPPYVRNDD
ncbi:unnamed protein product [Brassicogethes aeneus]|uniref:Uncharacterized protein n=1 Tax=Brassicogethes aeneus TaxID=1431903 RepID=A0A9P0FCC8_BRAAE|nr:unnamed protein product [Brassicogethes aeneus]